MDYFFQLRMYENIFEEKCLQITSKFDGKILHCSSLYARSKSLLGITYSMNGLLLSASENRVMKNQI